MRGHKKKKSQKDVQTNNVGTSVVSTVCVGFEMPTADVVAEERANEAAYERELAALMLAEGSDSSSSDDEAYLRNALRPLQLQRRLARAPSTRPAAALLPALAAALRDAHSHDVRFLDDYISVLKKRTEAEVQALTEELMESVEQALSKDSAGGVVLACWLSAAAAWRTPRVPGVLPALHCLLQLLTPHQVSEVASALHAALQPSELLVVSDAARCVGGGGGSCEEGGGRRGGRGEGGGGQLTALLLRAALAKLFGYELERPVNVELYPYLIGGWNTLGATGQLTALALIGRLFACSKPKNANKLLAALPQPRDMHDPDNLKVIVAIKTLRNLLNAM